MSETGNLYRGDFATEFMETVWEGCSHRDCLPQCRTLEGHCERLKLEYDEWLHSTAKPVTTEQLDKLQFGRVLHLRPSRQQGK